jgi:hypothetical protein
LNQLKRHFLERPRIEASQDPSEGVVRGDAIGQVEEAGEPGPAVEAELLDRGERVGPREDAADRDEDDVDQGVLSGPFDARVLEVVEVFLKGGGVAGGHRGVRQGRFVRSPYVIWLYAIALSPVHASSLS